MAQRVSNRVLESLVFPVLDAARGRRTMQKLKLMREMQHWPREAIVAYQTEATRRMLEYAAVFVPYYARQFKETGFEPRLDFRELQDLEKLPRLTKEDLKTHFEQLTSQDPNRRYSGDSTGGSTGVPTMFRQDAEKLGYLRAAILLSFEWAGFYFGDRKFHIGGSSFDAKLSTTAVGRLKNLLWNQRTVSSFGYNEATLDEWALQIKQFHPHMVSGYGSVLAALARRVLGRGERLSAGAIVTSSEYLYPEQRQIIEAAFGCHVFDNYSSREFALAAECHVHSGYHIHESAVVLECVDEAGLAVPAGASGAVLVTDLYNYAFPFIRYEIGDLAIPAGSSARCECGVNYSLLEAVVGRQGDQLTLPDGRKLPHQFFPHLFKDVPGIREYQLIQERRDFVRLRLVKGADFSSEAVEYLVRHIQQHLGPQVQLNVQYVDSVRVGSSDKLRTVISYVE